MVRHLPKQMICPNCNKQVIPQSIREGLVDSKPEEVVLPDGRRQVLPVKGVRKRRMVCPTCKRTLIPQNEA